MELLKNSSWVESRRYVSTDLSDETSNGWSLCLEFIVLHYLTIFGSMIVQTLKFIIFSKLNTEVSLIIFAANKSENILNINSYHRSR